MTGFQQTDGNRIHLNSGDTVAQATPVNSSQDLLVTLSDTSTIRLVNVSHIDATFFS